jgi:hypothetical protein
MALEKLLAVQDASGFRLITPEEIQAIQREWETDGLQHIEKVEMDSPIPHFHSLPIAGVPTNLS